MDQEPGAQVSVMICGAQCKVDTLGPLFKILFRISQWWPQSIKVSVAVCS